MADKESYQTAAKENLKRLVDEKLEAAKKLKEVDTSQPEHFNKFILLI